MGIGLGSLTGQSSTGIDVNKNVDLTSSDEEIDNANFSIDEMDKEVSEDLRENARKKRIEARNKSLSHKLDKILHSKTTKKVLDNVISRFSDAADYMVEGYKTCLDQAETELSLSEDMLENSVENLASHVPYANVFIQKTNDSIIVGSTIGVKSKINKDAKRLDNCNSNLTSASDELGNSIVNAAAANMVGNMDCANGNGIEAVACINNGLFSSIGVKSSMASKIMRDASDKINITSNSLDKLEKNPKVKQLAKVSFKHKKTILKAFTYKDRTNGYEEIGSKSIDIFGKENIKNISTIAKTAKKRYNKYNKHKGSDFFLAGAIKKAMTMA